MDNWRTAHLKQARSDMAMFEPIREHPLCQRLHYLQMATEKLGKAYLADGNQRPPQVHQAFVRFLRVCRDMADLHSACRMSARQFRAYIASLLDTARKIEALAPVGGVDKPNPEYPWQENGRIIAPVDYPFAQYQLTHPKMAKLLWLVRTCMMMG
jgi:hypothetical protein